MIIKTFPIIPLGINFWRSLKSLLWWGGGTERKLPLPVGAGFAVAGEGGRDAVGSVCLHNPTLETLSPSCKQALANLLGDVSQLPWPDNSKGLPYCLPKPQVPIEMEGRSTNRKTCCFHCFKPLSFGTVCSVVTDTEMFLINSLHQHV